MLEIFLLKGAFIQGLDIPQSYRSLERNEAKYHIKMLVLAYLLVGFSNWKKTLRCPNSRLGFFDKNIETLKMIFF